MAEQLVLQVLKAGAYYVGVSIVVRVAGKRMAGQTATLDLIVLITLGVVLQAAALQPGWVNALTFVVVVFSLHQLSAMLCARYDGWRRLVRGKPRPLIRDGRMVERALAMEGLTPEEVLAGLRKLGFERPDDVKLAVLEETGHISAVPRDPKPT
jgi:uncharacterized membrane protein YcaP (DUF421 family)